MLGPVGRRFTLRARRARLAAAGVGALALLGAAAVGASAQIALPTLTPVALPLATPTPTPLCVLIVCNPLDPGTGTQSTGNTPTPTPTPCLLNVCLPPVNPTCDPTQNVTCIVATPTPCTTGCGGGGKSPPPTFGPTGSSTHSSSSSSSSTSDLGLNALGLPPSSGTSGGTTVPVGLDLPPVPVVAQVGPGSAFAFGHAPILWPLFGILDVLGLAALYVIVRRLRSADTD